jgi:hypothetical protein
MFFQRYPTDQAYFIAKEILMTERTYKKDLEIINLVRKKKSKNKSKQKQKQICFPLNLSRNLVKTKQKVNNIFKQNFRW